MNPYITKLNLSLPLAEARIRSMFADMPKFTKQRFAHWKRAKMLGYEDPNFVSNESLSILGNEDLEWLKRINQAIIDAYGPNTLIFDQFNIKQPYKDQFSQMLPPEIRSVCGEFTVQWAKGGDYIQPHRDHHRKCGLFYAISKPDCETRWHKKKVDFSEYDTLRFAFPDDLEVVYKEIIQPGSWYLFNNQPFHSVHRLPDIVANRKSFVIDFYDMSYEEVLTKIPNEILNGRYHTQ
jgi:hypothetical protein